MDFSKTLFASPKPAHVAGLVLIAIQVVVGILFKATQSSGKYAFSASSSITISEFLKFLLSTFLFYREFRSRADVSRPLEQRGDDLEDEEATVPCQSLLFESDAWQQHSQSSDSPTSAVERLLGRRTIRATAFFRACSQELSTETRYVFAHMALFYVFINNMVFVLFRLADPGTLQLVKSGFVLTTAIVSVLALGATITSRQWLAIILNVCGIITTQYNPNRGAAYSFSAYSLLVLQTTVSAVASVYNQKLCRSSGSMHVKNMVLNASGASINLIVHIVVKFINSAEPGFFTGYGSLGAFLIIFSNIFIGMITTAVYYYVDSVTEYFAMTFSTVTLLSTAPILFHTKLSLLVIPGTAVVFIATWLYMDNNPPSKAPTSPSESQSLRKRSLLSGNILRTFSPQGSRRQIGLGLTSTFAISMVVFLTYWSMHIDAALSQTVKSMGFAHGSDENAPLIYSPFNKTLAFIRWNSYLPQRIESIKTYSSYFNTLHISMPNMFGKGHPNVSNLTHDDWEDKFLVYQQLRSTMQLVLKDQHSSIEGLFYFHFDAWIDPLRFTDMDFSKIWYPDSSEPRFLCMKSTARYPGWWQWDHGVVKPAKEGVQLAKSRLPTYTIDPEEWCSGWSDIYYIPRRFFRDYINLSDAFYVAQTFHEIAIPTMIRIIDKTHQIHPTRSLITRIGDCWGNCCASNPTLEDISWNRCGHRFNFQNNTLVNYHFRKLRDQALTLGRTMEQRNSAGLQHL